MCGIVGFLETKKERGSFIETRKEIALRMAACLVHRGPDAQGVWVDSENGITFAHTRLSIIDLSPAGRQPMHSASGRYTIVFNGEIYNFREIRRELEAQGLAPFWRGHSDTEVLLAAIEAWGLERALKRIVGMFAFALWDSEERTLYLVRDRMGEKPLYYGWQGNTFLFASELKSLTAHPDFQRRISRDALALYLRFSYIPTPYTIYEGIYKLPPGCCLRLKDGAREEIRPYWRLEEVVNRAKSHPFRGSPEEAREELEAVLLQAIKGQMISDVPLGAFLSGGIDSSTIVALMQKVSSQPVRTFSIGFHEDEYNEAPYARAIASHLKTEHTELYVTPKEALDVIQKLPEIYDEPFADSSQIPTYLLSKLTREHVTVSLSGDAGDELFGGYNRYFLGLRLWRMLRRIPKVVRLLSRSVICSVSPEIWDGMLSPLNRFPSFRRVAKGRAGDRLYKLAELLQNLEFGALYKHLVSHWKEPEKVVLGGKELNLWPPMPDGLSVLEYMMYVDQHTYLPDDILVKVDRAAMAVSLETRIPFLDHRLVEFVWRLPVAWKIQHGQGKWILKQVLYRYVPKELVERPKHGFGVPLEEWLRGPLKGWAEALLDEARLRREGFFDPAPIRQIWKEHLEGRRAWHYYLWDVLMFQAWLERWDGRGM